MKRLFTIIGLILMSLGVLGACSSSTENDKLETLSKSNDEKDNGEVSEKEDPSSEEKNSDQKSGGETDKETEKVSKKNAGTPKDQKNLKIGDTATIQNTLGKFEVTVNSIKKANEIDGEKPLQKYFFIVEMTVKNVGDTNINALDPINSLELTSDLKGQGMPNDSAFFDSIDELTGTLKPGESASGQAVFDGEEVEPYYLLVDRGLFGAGVIYNNAIWTFEKTETE